MSSPEIVTGADSNRSAAIQTRLYVKKKMDIGSSNKFGDNLAGLTLPVWCVTTTQDQIAKDLKSQAADVKRLGIDPRKAMVETWARHARDMGCGNCGEQSALAFVHLRDVWKVSPLDWMEVGGLAHGFVAIGRTSVTNPAKIETWNPEAVVCDPWRGFARPAKDATYLVGEEIRCIYRIESAYGTASDPT
jgi:hypothetical protein